jgi:hypothetical protein
MRIDGGCHCGYLAYEAEIASEESVICHCTDCQTLSGSPFRNTVHTTEGSFRLLSGEPTIYVKTSERGNPRLQAFCPRCGTPIYATSPGDGPKVHGVRVGSIRQRDRLAPRLQIWSRSAQPWVNDLAAIPRVEAEPA